MNQAFKQARRCAIVLLVFAVVGTGVMTGSYLLTNPIVQANQLKAKQLLIGQTLTPGSYDNNPAKEIIQLSDQNARLLGNDGPSSAFIARKNGQIIAYVFEAVAPNGYGGKIKLLVGVKANGTVNGIRVVAHRETPGLGDYIDLALSPWAHQFEGKQLENEHYWAVKKDGGQFDYMTGATISARAVTQATGNVLKFYRDHQDALQPKSHQNKGQDK